MLSELILTQAKDIFRIGLLIALIATMLRTQQQSGTIIPLAAGIVFVAVLIPMTMSPVPGFSIPTQIATGIAINTVYVAIGLAVLRLFNRKA